MPASSALRPGAVLKSVGLVVDRGDWIEEGVLLGCAYPRREAALAALAAQGISLLLNLHERPHDPARLAWHGLVERHLPVPDFTLPTPDQLARGLAVVAAAVAQGQRVAVHCGGGLGRTGAFLACYVVDKGLDPEAAIARVRAIRPGSVETACQVAAVRAYAARVRTQASPH
jgi:predicted protein tyrosine phosphatase